jgi:hypothetical protein
MSHRVLKSSVNLTLNLTSASDDVDVDVDLLLANLSANPMKEKSQIRLVENVIAAKEAAAAAVEALKMVVVDKTY